MIIDHHCLQNLNFALHSKPPILFCFSKEVVSNRTKDTLFQRHRKRLFIPNTIITRILKKSVPNIHKKCRPLHFAWRIFVQDHETAILPIVPFTLQGVHAEFSIIHPPPNKRILPRTFPPIHRSFSLRLDAPKGFFKANLQ